MEASVRHFANSLFFLGVMIMTAFTIPACGGGGSSSAAVAVVPMPAPPPGVPGLVIHESVVFNGPWSPGVGDQNLTSMTFAPTNGANDVVFRVELNAIYTKVAGDCWLMFDILDSSGKYISDTGGLLMQETGSGKILVAAVTFGSPSLTPHGSTQSASYTIALKTYANPGYSGTVDSVRWKIVVGESATTVAASPTIF